jgi:hypothetical protein
MSSKPYKVQNKKSTTVHEPAVDYQPAATSTSSSGECNPNHPVHATEEEWQDHFHQIEKGKFYTAEEYNRKWEIRKKEILAKYMS